MIPWNISSVEASGKASNMFAENGKIVDIVLMGSVQSLNGEEAKVSSSDENGELLEVESLNIRKSMIYLSKRVGQLKLKWEVYY